MTHNGIMLSDRQNGQAVTYIVLSHPCACVCVFFFCVSFRLTYWVINTAFGVVEYVADTVLLWFVFAAMNIAERSLRSLSFFPISQNHYVSRFPRSCSHTRSHTPTPTYTHIHTPTHTHTHTRSYTHSLTNILSLAHVRLSHRFPFYYELKIGFLLWMIYANGAVVIYEKLLRPYLLQNQVNIDQAIDSTKVGWSVFVAQPADTVFCSPGLVLVILLVTT
jgi:TB2/DP1, HVA22 family